MANPFDLRGPEFLVFYVILGMAANLLLRFLISWKEKQNVPAHWDSTDPYKVAYLRAGINEALRTALFSLIDRGLVKATDVKVQAERKAKDLVKRPIEKEIVQLFEKPLEVKYVYNNSAASNAGKDYQSQLASEGLIADFERHVQQDASGPQRSLPAGRGFRDKDLCRYPTGALQYPFPDNFDFLICYMGGCNLAKKEHRFRR